MRRVLIAIVALIGMLTPIWAQAANHAILINFTSDHCQACQAMKPVMAQLEQAGVPVRHVNTATETAIALRYGIRQTPTFVIVSGGKELTRLVGVQSPDRLMRALQTNPSGPLFQTNAKSKLTPITAPPTRLAPRSDWAPSRADAATQLASRSTDRPALAPRREPQPSAAVANAIERAQAATVRLRVHDDRGYGAGTGTVIDTHGDEALILTCGHLFRDTEGKGKIEVDLFVGGDVRTVLGQVLDYDADDRDIALVTIRPGFRMTPVPVISPAAKPRTGQPVFSFGCDRGDDPSRRDTRITGIDKYNQHLGVSNIEIAVAPIDGRSGGGLFDQQGNLIGVCNAADYKNDIGIYAGPGNVHWQLDRVGLARLYKNPSSDNQTAIAAAAAQPTRTPPPANRLAALNTPAQTFAPRTSTGSGTRRQPAAQAIPAQRAPASSQEVIVIVRDRARPNQTAQVMTLDQPSPDLMRMLHQQAR